MSLPKLLPNCSQPPVFLNPAFTPWDEQLIAELGGRVLPPHQQLSDVLAPVSAPDTSFQPHGTLLYMPCCPRSLYADVVRYGLQSDTLPHMAILGNSIRALSDSNMLLQALMRGAPSKQGPAGQRLPSGTLIPPGNDDGDDTEEATPPLLMHLIADQAFIELPCPDCGAHGVAVSLHAFPPARLKRLRATP